MVDRPQCARLLHATWSVAVLVTTLVVGCGNNTDGQAPTAGRLPLVSASSGIVVKLTSVESTDVATNLVFRIEDEHPNAPPSLDGFEPPTPADVDLQGLTWSGPGMGSVKPMLAEASPAAPQPLIGYELTLLLGPVEDPNQPVVVTFRNLTFAQPSTGRGMHQVAGEWRFMFTPAGLGSFPTSRLPLGARLEAEGVVFHVDEIVVGPTDTRVVYRIDAPGASRVEPTGIVARLPDGSFVHPSQIDVRDGAYHATFPPFAPGSVVTISLSPPLVEIPARAQIVFPVDGGAARASHRELLPVNVPATVAGERLLVTDIVLQENTFTIRVRNDTPGTEGRILLRIPGSGATLTDDRGNRYLLVAATSNFGKSDPVTMWADASSFTFAGPIDPAATRLTLRVESYGRQLRGPWQMPIRMPDNDA